MAVNNDAAFKNTKKEYKKIRLTIGIIWIVSIIGMTLFTFVIGYNRPSGETFPIKIYQSEEPVISPSETEINTNSDESRTDLSPNIEKGTQENSFQTE